MLVPVKWLSEYVDIDGVDIKELEEKLILSGSNTEKVREVAKEVSKVVVGHIKTIEKHPDADKLLVMQVDVGEAEMLQIVTGAKNCNVDDYVPVALHGSTIAGGVKIKKGKLRGVASQGMLCSLEEMGFDKSVIPKEFDDGILILDKAYELGMDIRQALGFDDSVIEFEITPNRPDCLSILGMARETAATLDRPLKEMTYKTNSESDEVNKYATIEIEDTEGCNRFMGKVVVDIKIEKSPMWLQSKLIKAGMRPISNIVDISNLIMLELGQPTHAYDLDTLAGHKLIAKRAKDGEKIVTLDDVERDLASDMVMIADADRHVGIGGVMGGQDTEIRDNTTRILLEAASFNKSFIRKTSKDLGLRSEASSRFEKGVAEIMPELAINRFCELVEELECGTIIDGVIDVYPNKKDAITIPYRPEKINAIIGIDISEEELNGYLNRLGIETNDIAGNWVATAPEYRLDLLKEIDLVEEVARMYGYDKIPRTLPTSSGWGARTNGQLIEDFAKKTLFENGVSEVTTYSFVSPRALDQVRISKDSILRQQVTLLNPLGEEYSVMRTTLVPNIMEVLERNYKRNVEEARVFEIGNVFIPREYPVVNLPIEKKTMAIGVYGEDEDFFTVKGIVVNLLDALGIKGYHFEAEKSHPTYHPGRCANVVMGNHILGTLGEVHPLTRENYDIEDRAYMCELDYNILLQVTRMDVKYSQLPKFPVVTRDIALIVKDEITSKMIEDIVKENGTELLESVKMFDLYRGKQIGLGHKSVAYNLIFRAADRTLVDEEVNKVYDKILAALESGVDAKLR